ncbi:hypothetical protein R3P38DRAFT_2794608 [Favolaschia claudopus]|uniref:Uncharacterized protein n=1 Tax=Favolaschia claudopus TaxID=2862362 RepID=A0AAW0A8E6_9AGAR
MVLRIAADWRASQRAKAGAGPYEAQESVESSYSILREPEHERHARQSSIQHPFPAMMMAPHKPHNLTSSAPSDNELALSLAPAHSTHLEKGTGRGLESQAKELVSKQSRTRDSANEKPSVSSGESQRQLRLQNAAKGTDRAQIPFRETLEKKLVYVLRWRRDDLSRDEGKPRNTYPDSSTLDELLRKNWFSRPLTAISATSKSALVRNGNQGALPNKLSNACLPIPQPDRESGIPSKGIIVVVRWTRSSVCG